MWPTNPRPPSRSSTGDQYNNNTAPANPFSRTAVSKAKPGRQSTDPWDWGWEDNSSGQQDDWNNGWGQSSAPAPNVIPNHPPAPSIYHTRQPEKKPHGTPDLIPEQVNNFSRGGGMVQQQYKQAPNHSDFFENIDLVSQNHGPSSMPPMYNASQGQPHQPPQNYPFITQPFSSQNSMKREPTPPTPASYFHQPHSLPSQHHSMPPQHHSVPPPPHSIPQSQIHSAPPQTHPIPPPPHSQSHSAPAQAHPIPPPPHSHSNFVPRQTYPTPPAPHSIPQSQSHSAPLQAHTAPPPSHSVSQTQPAPPQTYPEPPQTHPLPTPSHFMAQPQSNSVSSQANSLHPQNKESIPYYQPSPAHPPNMFQNTQCYQPEVAIDSSSNFYGQNEIPNQSDTQYYDQNKVSTQESTNYFDQNKPQTQEHQSSYYDQNRPPSQSYTNYYDQKVFMNNTDQSYETVHKSVANVGSEEVENVEVAPPEKTVTSSNQLEMSRSATEKTPHIRRGSNLENSEETNIPDNQETVPDNEEHLQNLPQKMSQMKITSTHNLEMWNNSSGWENQEVAPRCELDRNQYLETGQLVDSNGPEEDNQPPEVDNNDEGEALPPPGLHRMVTGQGTDSLSHREPPSGGGGFVRLVPGQPTPRTSPEPSSMERLVPGQQNLSDERMIPGHQVQDSQRFPQDSPWLLPGGQTQDERMVPGQLSDDENNTSTDFERMIPGGTSEHEVSFPRDVNDERRVTGAGSSDTTDLNTSVGGQESSRHVVGPGIDAEETVVQPPPGLHRLVLGQINSEPSTDTEHVTAETVERAEEAGMQRMVVGQFREKEGEAESEKEKETVKSNNRDEDSDSDYARVERRRHRHHKDYDDERKERERDYSSEREYRERGKERRGGEYRKKRDNSYNRSPEYRSDHEDYDREDYRERRERDRRDRPRDRDRRRRSPDPYYREDPYYRDDPRRLAPRDRDRRYYEPYEEDPYYYRENRSRPSSRSGLEYRRHRDYPARQPYYPEPGGMDSWNYYRYQQYYENMRRTDPAAYALWYERYMAEKYGSASNDRASVHSGRSSANEHSHSHENEEDDREGIKGDDTVSQRSTPQLYTSSHVRGQFHSLGQLIVVDPHDPFSYGQHQATVTVWKVAGPNVADTPDTLEFLKNPGPFISGVTHKNTVLQYLKKERDQLTHSSERLLYDLICLVIKLNGVVDMTDVADLLMESYRQSHPEGDLFPETAQTVDSVPLSPHQVTSRFRDLLLEGNKTEALEWAIKNKDWGHALFLASKMDSRTHNNVMVRFANGLQTNDPLQTLYQLMSGHEPQAATCAADKRWGDWRPHLAMMLSNCTANVELDRKAILTLGDSLGARGRLFAAHFCYLTAQLEFSCYTDRHPKLVLLGASVDKPFSQFASCRAIMLTICYEFAKQLRNRDWCIPSLRYYKFLLACTLIDHGNLSAALAYLEWLAQDMVRLPSRDDRTLAQLVINIADKVKCADSSLAFSGDPASDPDWLARLKQHVEETNDPNYLSAHMTHGVSTSTVSDMEPISSNGEHLAQPATQEVNQTYAHPLEGTAYPDSQQVVGGHTQENYYSQPQPGYYEQPQSGFYDPNQNLPPQDLQGTELQSPDNSSSPEYWSISSGGGWEPQGGSLPTDYSTALAPANSQPQISVKPRFGYFAGTEENIKPQAEQPTSTPGPAGDRTDSKDKSKRRAIKTQSDSGWFKGIWDKLALRPKNQMVLPDDKNPSIIWDEKTKSWVDTNASEEEQRTQLKPPPKASELNGSAVPTPAAPAVAPTMPAPTSLGPAPTTAPSMGPTAPSGLPPPAASTNKYKMQRNKGMRSNYVDILASSNKPVASGNTQSFAPMPQAPVANFFIPAPVSGSDTAPVDFLSPSGPVSFEPSTNKLDDQPPPGGYGKGNATFYNPSHYKS